MALLLQPGYSRNLRVPHSVSLLDVRPSFMLTDMSKHTEFWKEWLVIYGSHARLRNDIPFVETSLQLRPFVREAF